MQVVRYVAALLALAMLAPGTGHAAWTQAKTRHFTVYSEGKPDTLMDFAQKLEKFDSLLRHVTNITDPEVGSPVQVFLLANEKWVKALAHQSNIAGFYSTSDRFAYAVLSREGKDNKFDLGAQDVLFHEYTHHFMLHHFPAAYPAWYVEGYAEFFSVIKFPKDGSVQFGHIPIVRAPGLVLGSPYPLRQLFARNSDGLGLSDGDRYYGTAWLLTHYFKIRPDRQAEISRYLAATVAGVPDIKPDSYFAGGIEGLEKDLKRYMKQGLGWAAVAAKAITVGEIVISPVEPAKGALIADELRLIGHLHSKDRPDLVKSIRATAAKFPSSADALALLAEAEWRADDKAAALADADRAIALDPALSRAYSVRAEALLSRAHDSGKAEDWKAALTAIVKANRADTEDPVPLALFYRYHAMKGGPMPQIGYDGLYKAFSILPQNPEYRFNLASALAVKGDDKAASRLLDPIAYSPHPSDMREAALKLKAELDGKIAGKADKAEPPPTVR